MQITAREIYEKALALINERDSEGAYHSDTCDFEKNAPGIMSAILKVLWLDNEAISGNKSDEASWEMSEINSLDDFVLIHPALAFGVFPYALASYLLYEEDRERAQFFFTLFRDSESKVLRGFTVGRRKPVTDVYSGG